MLSLGWAVGERWWFDMLTAAVRTFSCTMMDAVQLRSCGIPGYDHLREWDASRRSTDAGYVYCSTGLIFIPYK